MPKMKSNRAAAKRLRVSGSGRIRRGKAGKSHLMRGKSSSRLRKLKKNAMVTKPDEAHVRRLLPYSF